MGGNNKALLRSRMKEAVKEREKRIDSPLVRYNELGQLACKVCNIVVKSDSLWPAHLVSRQHKEVVEEIKARVKKAGDPQVKPASTEVTRTEVIHSSSVPADFLDSPAVKRAKKGYDDAKSFRGYQRDFQDMERINYHQDYLTSLLDLDKAIEDIAEKIK